MSRKCYFAGIISRGSCRSSYASAQLFRGRRSTFEASNWKSLKRIVILRSSVWSTCHFWRKSRRKASFFSFKVSILKEVSQKSFVFELHSFIFEGSVAEMLRFWSWNLHFWRKSRRNAWFLSFKASFLKEVSQKYLVFDLETFIFSLAEMLGFLASKLQFWRKSRRKASFDKIIWITHQLTTKSLEPQIIWHPNHLNLKSIDNQLIWISNQLTTKSLESQINWQPNHLNLNQLTTTSLEVQINRQPKSFEAHIDWQPNHLNLKSIDNQINWISNHSTTKIIWISNQMTTKSFDSQLVWTWHQSAHSLPIGSLSLETSATALCGRYVIYNKRFYFFSQEWSWWFWSIGGHTWTHRYSESQLLAALHRERLRFRDAHHDDPWDSTSWAHRYCRSVILLWSSLAVCCLQYFINIYGSL